MEAVTLFFTTFLAQFAAEMGDKTQLMLIALCSKYKFRNVLAGTLIAVVILNAAAVLAGSFLGSLLPVMYIKFIAAAAFLFFAFTALKGESEEEEKEKKVNFTFEIISVMIIFIIAEAGDKTQFTALTFGASHGLDRWVLIWLACSMGLFSADALGLIVAYIFNGVLNEKLLAVLSFVLFMIFGFISLNEALSLSGVFTDGMRYVLTGAGALIFSVMCIIFRSGIFRSKSVK